MKSEFSKRELTFQFDNWNDEEYTDFEEPLFEFVKENYNDIAIKKKTDCLYLLDNQ